ncbi:MAG TPA: sugar phosphate nucleotidyltransferase [Clostridia bacterium]|nr:sugar phosphate nucleotidyltransferase [Clostridia bacterium]
MQGVSSIKGVIMSGGVGTRLRPLTCHLPKPMVPIFNKPVMEYGINLLKKYGINDIAVTLCYLPKIITDYFEDGLKFNVNINYYIEDKPLGTGGSVKNAHEFFDSTIVVISGDAFTNIDLGKAYDFHKEKGSKATLILSREPVPLEYGVVITDDNGMIMRFLEKPSWGEVFSDTINTGIYILEPEVLDYYKQGENFDFSKDLFPRLLQDNVPMYGYITEEYWCDVGDLNTYIETHVDVLSDEKKHYLLGKGQGKGIWLGEGTILEKGVKIYPPIYIGENSLIREGAVIDSYTVIGNNCTIEGGTSIKRSIIWDNVNISGGCEIRKSTICNNVYVGRRSRIFEGAVIGPYSKIFEDSTVKPNVKIWPYKIVDEKITVKNNLIWEERMSRKLFGGRNISGVFNESITPEIATGLGTAFATIMDEKGTYLISSDEYNLSKSIKGSIVSGILSTGSRAIDIKNSTLPMCRFGVRYFKANGGIHIRNDNSDENMIYIEFIDKEGANIDKNKAKKIENCLAIENFKRCTGGEVEDVVNIYNFSTIYLKSGMNQLRNIDKIKNQRPGLIISSPSKNICDLAERYLEGIGCQVKTIKHDKGLKIEDIQNMVSENQEDLGLLYDENGEKIALTDGTNIIQDEKYYLLALLIGLRSGEIENVIIPYNYPRAMGKLVEEYKGHIIYSKSDISHIIQTIMKEKTDFQYILNFDNIWATGRIVDYLMGNDITLNEIVEGLPKYFYLKREIPCKWDDKGSIIRRLTQDRTGGTELKEGVRFIDDKGWALIIPDEERPVFNLYAEGYNEEYAEELWVKYDEKIKSMMKD